MIEIGNNLTFVFLLLAIVAGVLIPQLLSRRQPSSDEIQQVLAELRKLRNELKAEQERR